MTCDHSGTHTGEARYLRDAGQLRLVLVCDACGAECAELERISYQAPPRFPLNQRPAGQAVAAQVAKRRRSDRARELLGAAARRADRRLPG